MDKQYLLDLLAIVNQIVAKPIYNASEYDGDLECAFCGHSEHDPKVMHHGCLWQQLHDAYLKLCAPLLANPSPPEPIWPWSDENKISAQEIRRRIEEMQNE